MLEVGSIREARARISPYIVETPLLRLKPNTLFSGARSERSAIRLTSEGDTARMLRDFDTLDEKTPSDIVTTCCV